MADLLMLSPVGNGVQGGVGVRGEGGCSGGRVAISARCGLIYTFTYRAFLYKITVLLPWGVEAGDGKKKEQ